MALETPVKYLRSLFGTGNTRRAEHASTVAQVEATQTPTALYELLRAYYYQNDLYASLRDWFYQQGMWLEGLQAIRNPAFRVVEFYVATMWPGPLDQALPIETDHDAIVEPIKQVWAWSNFGPKKAVAVRTAAMLGDLFLKVAQTADRSRVYLQVLDPANVTAFDVDERGIVQWIRIDTRHERELANEATETYWRTEWWDVASQTFALYEHTKGPQAKINRLGDPVQQNALADFGIDWIPIVHAPFRDVGEVRGMGAFTAQIDKIDEGNRVATRLHQMIFRHNKPLWALQANQVGPDQRPLPAPSIGRSDGTAASNTLKLGDDALLRLPGNATLTSLVPDLKYADHITALDRMMGELGEDLPELRAYRLHDAPDLSGKALRYLMAPAIKRVEEARGNLEPALVRAHQMALTIGQIAGLFPTTLGTYEQGAFDHAFAPRDVLPLSADEEAATRGVEAATATTKKGLGIPQVTLWRELGYTDTEIREMEAAAEQEQAKAQERLQASMAAFDAGGVAPVTRGQLGPGDQLPGERRPGQGPADDR